MLRHYDAIGLLNPVRVEANGYRLYTRDDALQLQEILLFRATRMPLAEIAALLDGDDRITRLESHRGRLATAQAGTARMIVTLDRTLAELIGRPAMPIETLYALFDAATQADHEAWLIEIYGADMSEKIAASKAHFAAVPTGTDDRMAASREIEAALVAAYEAGTPANQADLAAQLSWVGGMWGRPCSPAAHAGLAEIYLAHPDFFARYEALSPGFSP